MSCMENKTVLRVEIPSLKGANRTDALKYFKPILGEPTDIDEDEDTGEVYYFGYDCNRFQPVYDFHNKKWGVDLVLHHSSDYKEYVKSEYTKGITLKEFEMLASELVEKFGVEKENIRLLNYDWYNGGDEPIYL